MGILNKTRYYLCGNLEFTEDAVNWRNMVSERLLKFGAKCFDPNLEHFVNQPSETSEDRERLKQMRNNGEWNELYDYMQAVVRRDLRYVDLSTFLICNLEPKLPTFGTIWELCVAHQQRKPVLFHIKNKSEFPLWLAGLFKIKFVFDNWEDLFDYVGKIDSGEIKADSKFWKILKNYE